MNLNDLLNNLKSLGKKLTSTPTPAPKSEPTTMSSLFNAKPMEIKSMGTGNYKPITILSPEATAGPKADLKKTLESARAMGDQAEAQARKFGEKVIKPIAKGTLAGGLTIADIVGKTIDAAVGLPGRIATDFNKDVPVGFADQVGKATEESTGSKTLGTIFGGAAGLIEPVPGPKGGKLAEHFTSGLIKGLAAEQDALKIAELLKTEGKLSAKVAEEVAPLIAKEGTTKGVEGVLVKVPEALPKVPEKGKTEAKGGKQEVIPKTKEAAGTKLLVGEEAVAAAKKEGKTIGPKVSSETAPVVEGTDTARSIGDIIRGKQGGKKIPPVSGGATMGEAFGKQKTPERRFVTRAKAMAPEEAASLFEGKYDPRSTKKLIDDADALIARDPEGAFKLAREGTDDKAVAVASRLVDHFIQQAKNAENEATKTALYERAAEVANDAAVNLTEHGRAVQAASILGRQTPEGFIRWTSSQIQRYNEAAKMSPLDRLLKGKGMMGSRKTIPELTGDQAQSIARQMEAIAKETDGNKKAMLFSVLQKEVKGYLPSSLYEKIMAVWKAGLLTGLKTTGINLASNASHGVSEIIKDVPASLVDRIASLFTGKRSLALTGKGALEGLQEGVSKGFRFMKTGYDERDALNAIDFRQVNFGKGKVAQAIQKYEESVFKLLGAEDQPFYYSAKARSLYSQAIAEAKNLGLKGEAYTSKISELVKNPTDQMLKYATMDAQTAVFQNKTALATAAKGIQKVPGGEVLLPFAKTPSAAAMQLFNYSPAGIVKTIIENIGKGKFDQRMFSQGMGRGLTGTAVMAIGAALAKNGMITTSRPTSEKERNQWQLEGKGPNMIKIDGKWRGVGPLGPLGMGLAVGANFQQGFDQSGSFTGGLGAAAAGAGSALTQQTFLYGINQAINALNDPTRYGGTFIDNLAGSIVPTIVADVARATDEFERRTDGPRQRIASRIPGLRTLLEPQVDTLGSKVVTPNFLTVMIDPTRPPEATQKSNDPVVLELRRLDDAGYNVTPTMLGNKNGYSTLSQAENTNLWVKAGTAAKKAIQDIMKDSVYESLDDEQKGTVIGKVVDQAEIQERAKAVVGATKGLKGKELNAKLAEMKADGLLTKNVYKWYASLGGTGDYPL